jgi:hypothetical protein
LAKQKLSSAKRGQFYFSTNLPLQASYFLMSAHHLLGFLCIFNDLTQARVTAKEAISKRHGIRTRAWTSLAAFGKFLHTDLNHATVLDAAHRLCF